MNTAFYALVTTGIRPLTINSDYTFVGKAMAGGLPWDLTGGTATLLLEDPAGQLLSLPGTITGGTPRRGWRATGPVGTWIFSWDLTDAQGRRGISQRLVKDIISSPV